MKRHIYFAFILLAISAVYSEDHIYCTLASCPIPRSHTLCKYNAGAVRACGVLTKRGLSVYEKQGVLELYNSNARMRQTVTIYEEGESSESDSIPDNAVTLNYRMEWDRELEDIAQTWADQCRNRMDECRNVDRFIVRQRVGMKKRSLNRIPSVDTLASEWYHQDRLHKLNTLNFQNLSFENTITLSSNIYIQLMRQKENRIGCGSVRTIDGEDRYLYLVCNYGIEE